MIFWALLLSFQIHIVFTNNNDGLLLPCGCPSAPYGGLARKAYISLMPYTAVGIGDQEFIEGKDFFLHLLNITPYPLLGGNITIDSVKLDPWLIIEYKKKKIALVPISSREAYAFYPTSLSWVEIEDPIAWFEENLPTIRAQADYIIILSHLGVTIEEYFAHRFGDIKEIALIIGGHSGLRYEIPLWIRGLPIVEAGSGGEYVGEVIININNQGERSIDYYTLHPLSEDVPEKKDIAELVEGWKKQTKRKEKHPLISTPWKNPLPCLFFYAPHCDKCERVQEGFLRTITRIYRIDCKSIDVSLPWGLRKYKECEAYYKIKEPKIPLLALPGRAFNGEDEIIQKLREYLDSLRTNPPSSIPKILHTDIQKEPNEDTKKIYIASFYQMGCVKCERAKRILSMLQDSIPGVVIKEFAIEYPQNQLLLEEIEERLGVPEELRQIVPAIVVGESIFIHRITPEKLFKTVEAYKSSPPPPPWKWQAPGQARKRLIDRFSKFGIIPIITAGLIDGINPCAFATILFLIAALTVSGRKGRILLFTGLTFSIGVFLTYTLAGSLALRTLRIVLYIHSLRTPVYLAVSLITIFIGIINTIDGIRLSRGNPTPILHIPKSIRFFINTVIRLITRTTFLIPMVFLAGIFVSLLELACTGQIYLPTLFFISRISEYKTKATGYLILYNIAFILPLIILTITASTKGAEAIRGLFSKNAPISKFLLGGVCVAMGMILFFLAI